MSKLKVLFLYPNLMLQTGFPMATCTFSAILKQEGFDVELFDTTFYRTEETTSDEARVANLQVKPFDLGEKFRGLKDKEQIFEDLVEKVRQYKPHLIAISILEDVFPLAVELLRAIEHFNIPVIAGGVFPTFAPEIVISEKAVTMVCIGEGEEVLIELCRKLSDNEDISRVHNLWVKRHEEIVKNPIRPLRNINLNPLPDFSIFHGDRFLKPMKGKLRKMAPVETHRGCPYSCSFCNSGSQKELYKSGTGEKFLRLKEVGRIHDEIKILIEKYGVEYIYFPADTFLAMSRDYLHEFTKMYKKFALPFYCQTRAETINDETVRCLGEMNCHSLSIGIEHGNEDFRYKLLKRKVSNKIYIDSIKLLEQSNIMVSVNNVIGFPDETRELAFDTINLNREFNAYAHNAYYFTPYHGTPLREYCVEKGYISGDAQTVNITKGTVLNMPQFPQDEIKGLVRTFTLYVKFPEDRYKEIGIAEKFTAEGNMMFKKLQQEFWQKYFK
ncbi:MAG: B12-binding domain-containing radical SAM protein [Ignavibacteriae bacterium]|nr:B12-binding domain-containing radical SAM protein [Ignavibacteriota bacterium]